MDALPFSGCIDEFFTFVEILLILVRHRYPRLKSKSAPRNSALRAAAFDRKSAWSSGSSARRGTERPRRGHVLIQKISHDCNSEAVRGEEGRQSRTHETPLQHLPHGVRRVSRKVAPLLIVLIAVPQIVMHGRTVDLIQEIIQMHVRPATGREIWSVDITERPDMGVAVFPAGFAVFVAVAIIESRLLCHVRFFLAF
jgi:hypothetical protein